jgi:hypothetical protein
MAELAHRISAAALEYSFPGSSMVEWAAVNRLVAGSSPARGAWNSSQISMIALYAAEFP